MKPLVLHGKTTFAEAVQLLDTNGSGFLPVVDDSGKLYGIITDGDIRRAVLKEERDLRKIINRNPVVAKSSESRRSITNRLIELKRRHMPVVDEAGRYLEVVVLNDFAKRELSNRVIIMAGGLGSRLGELTQHTPKPMLKVNGKPILQKIIESFREAGFRSFTLCLNYKPEVIQNYFQDGSSFEVSIDYTIEKKRLGTAGALCLIDKEKLTEPFLVTNADIITSLNYADFLDAHEKSGAIATVCTKQYSMQMPYASIMTDDQGNLIGLEEKPLIPFDINAGIYAFSPRVLRFVPNEEFFDMPSLLLLLKDDKQKISTFRMDEYWIDIGRPVDFDKASQGFV